jgi:uncharacterized protein YndB with AHSA1/START domain
VTVTISVEVTIDAPPAVTWRALEDIASHVRWMADAESITFTTPHHTGVGVEFDCITKVGPIRLRDRMRTTEWSPGEAMGVEHHGVVSGRGAFGLRADGAGATTFSWVEALQFPWWLGGPIGEQVARPVLLRLWRGNVARLKRIVETPAADG